MSAGVDQAESVALVIGETCPVLGSKRKKFMKQIEAILKPFQFADIKEALMELGVDEITVTEVKGFGRQGYTEIYHGAQYCIDFLPEVKIQVLVSDEKAPQIIDTIRESARGKKTGNGKIFVTSVEEVICIGTEERGAEAI